VLVVAIEVVRGKKLAVASLVISLTIAVLVTEAQVATGRTRWTRRAIDLAGNIEYTRHVDDAPTIGGYAALLAQVPAGATIAIWIARPERLDYAHHQIIDLRTPRVAPLRGKAQLTDLATAARVQYLLVELDDRRITADDLAALAAHGRIVATAPGLRLVAFQL
jgi:hypothetical protein